MSEKLAIFQTNKRTKYYNTVKFRLHFKFLTRMCILCVSRKPQQFICYDALPTQNQFNVISNIAYPALHWLCFFSLVTRSIQISGGLQWNYMQCNSISSAFFLVLAPTTLPVLPGGLAHVNGDMSKTLIHLARIPYTAVAAAIRRAYRCSGGSM